MKIDYRRKLDIWGYGELFIREEYLHISIGKVGSFKILFMSDLHLGAAGTSGLEQNILDLIASVECDIILLGGDLVERSSAIPRLQVLLLQFKKQAEVAVVSGNHDHYAGIDLVRIAVQESGALWLESESHSLKHQEVEFHIHGNVGEDEEKRDGVNILCAHDPAIFPNAVKEDFDLVLAGHLHGGQMVLYQKENVLYPAAWVYKWNMLRYTNEKSTLIVSRGLADSLPIRWNCPREVVLCTIECS